MTHTERHPFAGQTMRIRAHVTHPQQPAFGGEDFHVEDWWDRVAGKSWMDCNGKPACLVYAMRSGFSKHHVPTDDEVVYG